MRIAWAWRRTVIAVGLVTLTGLLWVATSTVTTRQGVNFHVSTHSIPLYAKALAFLDRHVQYQLLAREITRECASDEERLLAVFQWTRAHIRSTPGDWPVVDDHILHIVIRGHGLADQQADVFSTLSTYAGVPAFWRIMWLPDGDRAILSFAKVEGRWVVVDVANDLVVRNASGALASLEELPAFSQVTLKIPRTLRARLQMPWPRLWYELRRFAGQRPESTHVAALATP